MKSKVILHTIATSNSTVVKTMATKEGTDEIETAEVTFTLPPPGGVYQMTSGPGGEGHIDEHAALQGESLHKLSVGGEHIPYRPLTTTLKALNAIGAAFALICGEQKILSII